MGSPNRPRHGQAATTNALFCRPQFTDSHGWRGFCKLAAVSLVYSVDFGRAVRCCERDLLHDQVHDSRVRGGSPGPT